MLFGELRFSYEGHRISGLDSCFRTLRVRDFKGYRLSHFLCLFGVNGHGAFQT